MDLWKKKKWDAKKHLSLLHVLIGHTEPLLLRLLISLSEMQ